MTTPDPFPRRMPPVAASAAAVPPAPGPADPVPANVVPARRAAGSWPWRRAGLLLCLAAQLITISALTSADPVPATWAALLLATAPVPLAALAAFAPATAARLAAALAAAVLVAGIAGTVTHTGLFFVPALVVLAVAAARLWREEA
jgi:hypothetical protein